MCVGGRPLRPPHTRGGWNEEMRGRPTGLAGQAAQPAERKQSGCLWNVETDKRKEAEPPPPLRAPLPAPKHSRAPVTRARRHTPTPDTRPLGCALRHTHTHTHALPLLQELSNSTAVRGAGFLGSAEPWAPWPREGTRRGAPGGIINPVKWHCCPSHELKACQCQGCFCGQRAHPAFFLVT